MSIVAIDPGTEESAYVVYDGDRQKVEHSATCINAALFSWLRQGGNYTNVIIEEIASYGMPVGREVFRTVFWSGMFAAQCVVPWSLLPRKDVKLHLCGQMRAKDANIRAALLDKFGPNRQKAIGTKQRPGPLYGLKGDEWQALALAVTWLEQ